MTKQKVLMIGGWAARIVAAAILGMSAVTKFTGDETSIYVFEQLGVEPWGRFGTATLELAAVVLLLIPALGWAGGALGTLIMLGAIGSHLTALGVVVEDDGGGMFIMAWIVLICSLMVVYSQRNKIPMGGSGSAGG